jgi:pilus assembly protein CpaB
MSLRVFLIGLMFTAAAAFGLIAYQITRHPPGSGSAAQAPVTGPLMVSYLVAARPIPAGTLTRPEDLAGKSAPSTEVPPGAIIDTAATVTGLRGSLVRHYIEPGAPVLQSDLLRSRDRGFLAAVLAPGMRAVSIGVDPVTGVAGLIWPGDRVDVILTQELGEGQANARATRLITSETVLANMPVIAVDQSIAQGTPVAGTSAGKLAATVTLQASSDDAEKLAIAGQLGRLSLAVRALDEGHPAGGDTNQAMTGADVSAELARAGAAAIGSRVQVIQGGQRGEVTFR